MGGRQFIICHNFPENCMNMKEIGPRGGVVPGAPFDPPMNLPIDVFTPTDTDTYLLCSDSGCDLVI